MIFRHPDSTVSGDDDDAVSVAVEAVHGEARPGSFSVTCGFSKGR